MGFRVRLFLDGEMVEPSEVNIKSVTIDRIVNDCIDNRMQAEETAPKKKAKRQEALSR
ncbi:MAG: hypothetical protein J6J07_00565 [Oscillospiraceae bacterium]|nr:hypothetical protein [Oscillospiraceae bacterium]MBQ5329542.1 hypothetical protein [Oscillospiraceae bacterium]